MVQFTEQMLLNQKSGKDDLREVVSNFEELKSKLQHWVDFFDS